MVLALLFLPGTGRGTTRRVVEGQVPMCATVPPSPNLHLHLLRWSPSPCRGGMA